MHGYPSFGGALLRSCYDEEAQQTSLLQSQNREINIEIEPVIVR